MKIKFWPTKDAVLRKLGHQLSEVQGALDESEKELEALKEKMNGTNFFNPENDRKRQSLELSVRLSKDTEATLLDNISLIESSEEVEVEVEVQ